MANALNKQALAGRLTALRAGLLKKNPFLGHLLLHLPFGFAPCGTAYTDMDKIVFDPEFAMALPDEELEFVLGHEVLHCVLKHCTRGKGLNRKLYNIACDIVVNSMLLEIMGITEFSVHGHEVMHMTPKGTEGREHTAEEIYHMFRGRRGGRKDKPESVGILLIGGVAEGPGIDNHDAWEGVKDIGQNDHWEKHIRDAAKACGSGSDIPSALQRYLHEVTLTPKTNWRQLLQDLIRHDRADFLFTAPDRRYSGDVLLPSFQENVWGERVEKLWFVVDTSGSISDEALTGAYWEIRGAVDQISSLSGMVSFFDTEVTEPIPFESAEDLAGIIPVGGGGTSFCAVFQYLSEHFEELPGMVIVATDGCAHFPDEEKAMGVPVVWLMIDSDVEAPWGKTVYITSE